MFQAPYQIQAPHESYFVGKYVKGISELESKKIAVSLEYEDYISIIDRRSKSEIRKISIPMKVGEIWGMREVADIKKKLHLFLRDK